MENITPKEGLQKTRDSAQIMAPLERGLADVKALNDEITLLEKKLDGDTACVRDLVNLQQLETRRKAAMVGTKTYFYRSVAYPGERPDEGFFCSFAVQGVTYSEMEYYFRPGICEDFLDFSTHPPRDKYTPAPVIYR